MWCDCTLGTATRSNHFFSFYITIDEKKYPQTKCHKSLAALSLFPWKVLEMNYIP